MLNTLDLFAGIGGFSLGLERTVAFAPLRSARSTRKRRKF